MEFYAGGSVDNMMIVLDTCLGELEIAYILEHCLKGLQYLHERKMIHRDIKPANIMIGDDLYIKLGTTSLLGFFFG